MRTDVLRKKLLAIFVPFILIASAAADTPLTIANLKKAVEDRNSAVESAYVAAYKLMSDYHTEIMAVPDAMLYSEKLDNPDEKMMFKVAYTDVVADKFRAPVRDFQLVKADFEDDHPGYHYFYEEIEGNQTQTNANREEAQTDKNNDKTSAQQALATAQSMPQTAGEETPGYWKPGTSVGFDYEAYQKAYWTWYAVQRKKAIESGTMPEAFGKALADFPDNDLPEHPGLVAHNQKLSEGLAAKRTRAIARAQRRLDAVNAASVIPSDAAVEAQDAAASLAYNDDAAEWLASEKTASVISHLDDVKDHHDALEDAANEVVVRKAAEKSTYLRAISIPGFFPCGAVYTKSEIKWKHPTAATMEQQIATLNQISQEVERLCSSYSSLGELSRFAIDSDSGLESFGFSGQKWEDCGLVTPQNYREKMILLAKTLRTMDGLPWPMLCKEYSLDRYLKGDKLTIGAKTLKLGEGEDEAGDTIFASAVEDIGSLEPWCPYQAPAIRFGNTWKLGLVTNANKLLDTEEDPKPWLISTGSAFACYSFSDPASAGLSLFARSVGGRQYAISHTDADPKRDGATRITPFDVESTSHIGDDDVKFKVVVEKIGDAVDTTTEGKTDAEILEIAQDYADAFKHHLERSYKNAESYVRLGLPKKLQISAKIETYPPEEGEEGGGGGGGGEEDGPFRIRCTVGAAEYLPTAQVEEGSLDFFSLDGDTELYSQWEFTQPGDELTSYGPIIPPRARFVQSDDVCSLEFPLTFRGEGKASPALMVSLFESSNEFVYPSHLGISNLGFSRRISVRNGKGPVTVRMSNAPLQISKYVRGNEDVSPLGVTELASAGADLSRIETVEFEGGKLKIGWTTYTHITCTYFFKSGDDYLPGRSYVVKVGGPAGQLYDGIFGDLPEEAYTVEITMDGSKWAVAQTENEEGENFALNCRVDYLESAGQNEQVKASRRFYPQGGSEFKVEGGEYVSWAEQEISRTQYRASLGSVDSRSTWIYGERGILKTPRTFEQPVPTTGVSGFFELSSPFSAFLMLERDELENHRQPHRSGSDIFWHKWKTEDEPELYVIPFALYPVKHTLSGEGWERDGETMDFDETGFVTDRTYKIAGIEATTKNVLSSNSIESVSKIGGQVLSTASTTFADDLATVTTVAAGAETTVKYYKDGELPWAVESVTTPFTTTTYEYTKVGTNGLKVKETVSSAGNGPVTVTETETNDFGVMKSMTRTLNGTEIAKATCTGGNDATFGRPLTVTIVSSGVTRTHLLQYHGDGTLKQHKDGNGRTDDFEWDVLGRIKDGTAIDGHQLNPTYDGLQSSFTLGGGTGETVETETSLYGELERYSSTVGAGMLVEKGSTSSAGDNSYTSTVTSEDRGAASEFLPGGLPKKLSGGLGTPGTGLSYSVATVNGSVCLVVARTVLDEYNQPTAAQVIDYYDGYGRLVRHSATHPMGTGLVNTDYAYDLGARRITITPPSPSKQIEVEYDPKWLTATVTQGGRSTAVSTSVTGATIKQVVSEGSREFSSTQVNAASGSTELKINGKNPMASAISSDGNLVTVTAPRGTSVSLNYNKYGFSSATGTVRGKSIAGECFRDGFGNVNKVSLDPPGPRGVNSADINKGGRVTKLTAPGKSLDLTYNYGGDGVAVQATGSPARNNFSVSEDSHGHPRSLSQAGKDSLQITGDARGGSVTVSLAGIAGQSVTQNFSASLYPLGLTRSDGSGTLLTYHANGELASLQNSDGPALGGGSALFTFTTHPATGFPTGFQSSKSSLVITPYPNGKTSSVVYRSTDIDNFTQQYTCQYPAYFDDGPLEEVFGGALAGFKIKRVYDPVTGESSKIELYQGTQKVHAVEYLPDAAGELQTVRTSGSATFESGYQRPTAFARKVTVGSVVTTRNLSADGSARLTSVNTQTGAGAYSATYAYSGQSRTGLTISSPTAPTSVWSYAFQDTSSHFGQLQSASLVRGGNPAPLMSYTHEARGNRAETNPNASNQYSEVRALGERTFSIVGRAAPGATVSIGVAGGTTESLTVAADGSFSRMFPVPPGAQVGVPIPVTVTGTLAGAGDNGTAAVFKREETVALTPSTWSTTYGAHGALATDWRWIYRWDTEGRLAGVLTKAAAVSAGMPNFKIKFAYDDKGRRIRKVVQHLSADGTTAERTVTTRFIYDDWRLLAEQVNDSAQASYLRTYTWGLDAFDNHGGENTVGALVGIHSNGQSYQPVYDGNGNVIALLNASGAEVASWERGPFGEILRSSGQTDLCPFGFATAYTDVETGLAYFGYRFYSPVSGRWLSREPLGEMESFNLYAYCHNDPVNNVDRLGLAAMMLDNSIETTFDKVIPILAGVTGEESHPTIANLYPVGIDTLEEIIYSTSITPPPIDVVGLLTTDPFARTSKPIDDNSPMSRFWGVYDGIVNLPGTFAAGAINLTMATDVTSGANVTWEGWGTGGFGISEVSPRERAFAAALLLAPLGRGGSLSDDFVRTGMSGVSRNVGRRGIGTGSGALYSSGGHSTGVDSFDRLVHGSSVFDNWASNLAKRGYSVEIQTLKAGDRAYVEGMKVVIDPAQFRYIDLLHESRHIAQISRIEGGWNNVATRAIFERGAYEYELRLGKKMGFSLQYMDWARSRISDYWTPAVQQRYSRSSTLRNLWR